MYRQIIMAVRFLKNINENRVIQNQKLIQQD